MLSNLQAMVSENVHVPDHILCIEDNAKVDQDKGNQGWGKHLVNCCVP